MDDKSSLDKWFQTHKEKRENTQVIESGLLKGSLASYYFYRLRYFLVRSLLSALIFSVEIRILIEGFGKEFFTQSLGARTLVLLLTAFWWAGLELLRTDIRVQKREDKPYIIPQIILSWRTMAGTLTLIIAAFSTLLLGLWSLISPATLFTAYGFYVLTLIARVLVDIPLRTYHSCVYATMRIYRPLYWIIATELVAFLMFILLKPTMGAWSVGISSLVSLTLSTAISYHYITQTYKFLGYDRGVENAKKKKRGKTFLPKFSEFLKKATPLTIFRLDAVLVLLLILSTISTFSASPTAKETVQNSTNSYYLLILIALCMPLLYAAQEWSMLLYFDYKKLEVRIFEKLRQKFNSGLKYLVVIISVALWVLLPILQWIAGQGWHLPPLSVLLLLISSSYLGQQAIRVFSLGSNRDLMFWGASLLTFLMGFLVWAANYSMDIKLTWVSLILLGHAVGLNIFAKDYSLDPTKILIPPTTWLKILNKTSMPWGGLIRIVLPKEKEADNTRFVLREAAKGLRKSFPGPIYMTNLTRTGLLFFGEGKSLIDSNYPTDYESLYKVIRKTIVPLLPESLERMIILPITIDNNEFLSNLSEGESKLKSCLETEEPNVKNPNQIRSFDFEKNHEDISVEDAREILSAAVRYHNNMDARGDKMAQNWDVACEEQGGVIVRIHATPKTRRNAISLWLHSITRQNLWRAWNENNKEEEGGVI